MNGAIVSGRGIRHRPGFTLLELLLVVGIIALLAGILVPTMRSVGLKARTSVCASNLRALQVAMVQFTTDNRFITPGTDFQFTNWVNDIYWEIWWGEKGRKNIIDGLIWPYVKHFEMYVCPTFVDVCRDPPRGAQWRPGVPYAMGYSGWGGYVPGFDPKTFDPARSYSLNEFIGLRQSSLFRVDLARKVWLCDESPWRQLANYPQLNQAYGINNAHLGGSDTPAEYHDGKANCVFGDGHVDPLAPPDILDDVWD